ncbi:Pancreatic triacylglycerol lipase, partial [Stegodyphus mimosarum]
MKRMANTWDLDHKLVHIIGHGLGAHASGYAGKWFQNRQKEVIDRITGLDPSGPFFNGVQKVVRLDKDDASFVDVIHTNSDGNRLMGYGLTEPIGHLDFYPNGGELQPGCETEVNATAETITDVLSYMKSSSLIHVFDQTTITRSTVRLVDSLHYFEAERREN